MSSALAMILTAGMMIGTGPGRVSEEVQPEFPPGSKWVAVRGWKGDKKVVQASVTFKSRNEVEIYWKTSMDGGGWFASTGTREYRIDQLTKLPVIPALSFPDVATFDEAGVFRLAGNRLKLVLCEDLPFRKRSEPPGELLLVLEPAK